MSQAVATLTAEALPRTHAWADRPGKAELAPLPNSPAVLLFVDAEQRPVQLLTTQALRRAVESRLAADEQPRRRADVGAIARGVRWRDSTCAFEARWWYYRLARSLHPADYRKLVAFGPAWFLHVDWAERPPELRVTNAAWCERGEFVGPWPSQREAAAALDGLWDLFDLCRHPEQVRKSPRGTRCAYADMGRCDAPCDGSVPLDSIIERSRRAWVLASGGVDAWIMDATERMRVAAREQRFEYAALLKSQLKFAEHWRSAWSRLARPLTEQDCVLALPVTRRKAWKLYAFRNGCLIDGPTIPDRRAEREMCAWFAASASLSLPDTDATVRMEQTWLVCHLLFSRESENVIRLPASMCAEAAARSVSDAFAKRRTTPVPDEPQPPVPE